MNMKKTSARLGAGTLALATVAAGLSFGPAAANAATTPSDKVVATFDTEIVFPMPDGRGVALGVVSGYGTSKGYASVDEAFDNAHRLTVTRYADDSVTIQDNDVLHNGAVKDFCLLADANVLTSLDYDNPCTGTSVRERFIVNEDSTLSPFQAPTAEYNRPHLGSTGGYIFADAGRPGLKLESSNPRFVSPFAAQVVGTDLRARTADLAGTATPNSTVIVNDATPVPVGSDGKWAHTVTGLTLGANPISLEQYEGTDKTGETEVVADLAVTPLVAVGSFVTDDVTKPLVIAGTAQPDAEVEIWQGTTKLRTVSTNDTGVFTADVVAPNAGGAQTYTVKQVIDGETASDAVSVTADFGAAVVIETPLADAAHDGGRLRFQGRGVPGADVKLREQGKNNVLGGNEVLPNGIWTIDVANIPGKKATYVATQIGKGNNVTTSSVTLNPDGDTTPPTVTPIVEGSNELSGSNGTPGAVIIVTDKDGKEVGRDTVDGDGNWKVTVPVTLGPGTHELDVVEHHDGEQSDATKVTVDFGAAIAVTGTTVANGVVTYSGTGAKGASAQVFGKSGRPLTNSITVADDGTWSATSITALPAQDYLVDAIQTTGIGVRSAVEVAFTIDRPNPTATPVAFTGPTGDVHTTKPTFTGTGEPGAKVIVKGAVRTVAETTVADNGSWSVQSNVALDNDTYTLTAVQTPTNGAAQSTDTNRFTIKYRAADSLVVTGPAADAIVAGPRPVFSGTGDAGATVVVKGSIREVVRTIVDEFGNWTAPSLVDLANDDYTLTVTQSALNGDQEQTTVSFKVR